MVGRIAEWYRKSPGAARKHSLSRLYGLTPEAYDAMLRGQGGGCAICGGLNKGGRSLSVDHDHTTGRVRGLLCSNCNTALGLLKESPALMAKAAEYVS